MRLIGVWVSALRDELNNRKFFINTHNDDEFENNEFDYKNDLFINCPICNEDFEGKEEFIQQHIEFCNKIFFSLFFLNIFLSQLK